jgi:3-ketoacyl-CoA synthase
MAAALVNKFRLRKDVLTYQLAGMGCSSSLICVDMVQRLFKVTCCAA